MESTRLYRVKPLVWVLQPPSEGEDDGFEAEVGQDVSYIVWKSDAVWHWGLFDNTIHPVTGDCNSIEHGKQLAQSHWESELQKWLEVAVEIDTNPVGVVGTLPLGI